MIELGHIGTGALAGAHCDGALQAFVAGFASHGLMDIAPHGEIHDRAWEMVSTITGIAALAARLGPRSPVVWGAIGAVLPDVEHALPRPLRRELYPTHRLKWTHSSDTPLSIPAWAQVMIGGAVVGAFVMRRRLPAS